MTSAGSAISQAKSDAQFVTILPKKPHKVQADASHSLLEEELTTSCLPPAQT
jgi:hypothetical protein